MEGSQPRGSFQPGATPLVAASWGSQDESCGWVGGKGKAGTGGVSGSCYL